MWILSTFCFIIHNPYIAKFGKVAHVYVGNFGKNRTGETDTARKKEKKKTLQLSNFCMIIFTPINFDFTFKKKIKKKRSPLRGGASSNPGPDTKVTDTLSKGKSNGRTLPGS